MQSRTAFTSSLNRRENKMSVTESDIECSTDSDSDVPEPKARTRPRSSQSIRSEANTHDV